MSNEIINALRRLERAGSEESRSTEKLREAAGVLAAKVASIIGDDDELPRGIISDGYGLYAYLPRINEHTPFSVAHNRETTLAFAHDIATGWLDELATWLEVRDHEASEASAVLNRAAEALR